MSSNIFRFREFPVYKEARKLRKDLKLLSREKFPQEENYVLRQQLWRALDSIRQSSFLSFSVFKFVRDKVVSKFLCFLVSKLAFDKS